ncbi:MAG: SAM-dependent chlorinase/fluorinase [Candidatus Bathyarchaeia archaeon]|nr:SAM-dependent chlorinase/fluorinase [Candidatus Bathyarchaeota archaeon]
MRPIITLLSDFGARDPYVAEMKGVILGICPEAVIVDVSHEVEKFNVAVGAFLLASAVRFFPKGCIHVAVVDPGVGGPRRPIFIETESGYLVGPDNGLLALAAEREGIKGVYEIKPGRYTLRMISSTFHGRDVFAPVAAYLARGTPASTLGVRVEGYAGISVFRSLPRRGWAEATILYVDSFGNLITGLSWRDAEEAGFPSASMFEVESKGRVFKALRASTYSEVGEGELALIPYGSHGFAELAVNRGDAAGLLGVKAGDRLSVKVTS